MPKMSTRKIRSTPPRRAQRRSRRELSMADSAFSSALCASDDPASGMLPVRPPPMHALHGPLLWSVSVRVLALLQRSHAQHQVLRGAEATGSRRRRAGGSMSEASWGCLERLLRWRALAVPRGERLNARTMPCSRSNKPNQADAARPSYMDRRSSRSRGSREMCVCVYARVCVCVCVYARVWRCCVCVYARV
jgi:hypothetical protein